MVHTQHHDIIEEPGTYRSNFACFLGMLIALVAIAYGVKLIGTAPGLGVSTIGVGVLALILLGARLWAGAAGWASHVVWLMGVYSWYSPHFWGINPSVFGLNRLGMCWAEVGIGLGLLFVGLWTALGAPGLVAHERFFDPIERSIGG